MKNNKYFRQQSKRSQVNRARQLIYKLSWESIKTEDDNIFEGHYSPAQLGWIPQKIKFKSQFLTWIADNLFPKLQNSKTKNIFPKNIIFVAYTFFLCFLEWLKHNQNFDNKAEIIFFTVSPSKLRWILN